ncbi:CFAP58 [Symbiodinium sp. KB8]|nr:CFAP58 [Symbiodinium sp. KB8]
MASQPSAAGSFKENPVDESARNDMESSAFEALEKDFQEVLQELIGDKSLEHFRLEYEKLHRALKKSHESEKRLIKKCRELNQEIVSNATKVQTALNLSKEDQATISNLKKEIERAWKMVEASHEKEQRAKETIHNLKVEIANLSHLVEQGAGLSVNQENTVNSLIEQRDELIKARDKLEAQVATLTHDNIVLTETAQRYESEKVQSEVEIADVKDMLNAKRTEEERETRRRDRLESELAELKQNMEAKEMALKQVKAEIKSQEEERAITEITLEKQRAEIEKQRQDAGWQRSIAELKRKKQEDGGLKKTIIEANGKLDKDLKACYEEIRVETAERDKTKKKLEILKRRKALDDEARHEMNLAKAVLRTEAENLIREIDMLKKQAETDSKTIMDLLRDRESLNRSLIRCDDRTKNQTKLVKTHDETAAQLETDVKKVKLDVQEAIQKADYGYQGCAFYSFPSGSVTFSSLKGGNVKDKKRENGNTLIVKAYGLDKTREKYGLECCMANTKYMSALEELKNRDNKISELKKNFADVKAKLSHQKQLYEAVRTDRNLYSKKLVESQDEIAEMKRKFKIMSHQIEQLKEEIKEKEERLKRGHHAHNRMQKECEFFKDQMERAKRKEQTLKSHKETQQAEIKKLESRILEEEDRRKQQKKKYEETISERDVLGTQLIHRNDELALQYEKIKIQQRTLQNGDLAFKQRQEEARTLNVKEAQLKRELHIGKQQVLNIDDLKRQVFQLQRELLQERTKVKALSEELENPMNVHRWRKLEGADPSTYEMMQKVKTLQKRLISKTEEAVEKDLAIQEKEKLYLEMRNLLDKQPSSEVVEEVGKQQNNLKEKTKQMKAMAAELNMYHAQLSDYKEEIERVTKELQDTKRRYFEQRHREQLLKDTSRPDKQQSQQVR